MNLSTYLRFYAVPENRWLADTKTLARVELIPSRCPPAGH